MNKRMWIYEDIPEHCVMEDNFYLFDSHNLLGEKSYIISGLKSWLALSNINRYHFAPVQGDADKVIPDETIYLLWQRLDGKYGIALPLLDGDVKVSFGPEKQGFSLRLKGNVAEHEDSLCLVYSSIGDDPYVLTKAAVKAISMRLKSFRIREEKAVPAFVNYFGWCTWDAFFSGVTEGKVLNGLESYKKAKFPLKYVMVDDGAWEVEQARFADITIDHEKFPNGFDCLVRKAKEDYSISIFGLWHCFLAYWRGITDDGPLSNKYRYLEKETDISPWDSNAKPVTVRLIHPDESYRFYNEFHQFVRDMGVDMVKIDGQCTVEEFGALVMQKYQKAMQESSSLYFDSQVIHCMSGSNTVAYNMLLTNCQRNSDDYSALNGGDKQKYHIFVNAMNNMWTSTFCIPDWDMFQSHSAEAEFHAAARAISGGPVYVSDYPGKQNFEILRKLVIFNGTILRCETPALPARECLFENACQVKKPLKVFNFSTCGGVLAFFNCYKEEEAVNGCYSVSDIEGLRGEEFAVYGFQQKTLSLMKEEDTAEMEIKPNGFEILTVVPVQDGVAPLGLLDKYNGSAAVLSSGFASDGRYTTILKDGGTIGFYSKKVPAEVTVNDKKVDVQYNSMSGLLTLHCDAYGKVVVRITF